MKGANAPVSQRADALRNHRILLEAALSVLARDPSAAMIDVAVEAGLTRATLYRHFPSRQVLLTSLEEDAFARAGAAMARCHLSEGTATEALNRAVRALIPLGLRFRVLLYEGAERDAGFLVRRAAVLAGIEDVVRRGQASGEISSAMSAEWIVAALTSLLVNAVRLAASGVVHRDDAADLVFRTLVEGIRAERPHDSPDSAD